MTSGKGVKNVAFYRKFTVNVVEYGYISTLYKKVLKRRGEGELRRLRPMRYNKEKKKRRRHYAL